jgi:Ca-activated chloride channel family protein
MLNRSLIAFAAVLAAVSCRRAAPTPDAPRGLDPEALASHLAAPASQRAHAGLYGLRAAASPSPLAMRPALDPNGRYATTYRPGGAALAAFEAALARGAIPGAYRTLVGDFGVRYAPHIAPPTDAALTFHVELGGTALPPGGGKTPLRIAIRSSASHPTRARLSVHLVLDNSSSMMGDKIANARRAAAALVARLADDDDFSLVVFSTAAEIVVESGPVGPRRAEIAERIHDIGVGGSTNIGAGLDVAYQEARTRRHREAVAIVMLLSDGHANMGTTEAMLTTRVAAAFQDGIQTSAFGLGADFDAALMSAIADQGAGGYYFLADSTQIAPAIAHELDARLVPVAQAVEVRVRLAPDIKLVKVYGSHALDGEESDAVRRQEIALDRQTEERDGIARDRQRDDRGGMRFFIPAFARDDHHATVIVLDVPRGMGDRSIGTVEVRYKDRLRKRNAVEELPIRKMNRSVAGTAEAFAAGDSILHAAHDVERGQVAAATARLAAASAQLEAAAVRLEEPQLSDDAQRLAALASALQDGRTGPVPLAVLLRGSGYGYLH